MIWYHIISYDMIWWYHMIWWHDIIWYDDMIWYDMIWYDMIWYDMISYDDMISYHMISYDLIWYHMTWYHMISYHIISYHMGAAKPHPWRLRAEKEKLFRKFCPWKNYVFFRKCIKIANLKKIRKKILYIFHIEP